MTIQNKWTFELAIQGGSNVPIYVLIWFMQTEQFNQQLQQINGTSYRPTVVKAHCIIRSECFQMQNYLVIMLLININKHEENLSLILKF